MLNPKEILFFCYGDARDASTWSNVPFCFVRALEKRGIKVNTVDIRPSAIVGKIWTATVRRVLNLFWKGNIYYFERSLLAGWLSDLKVRRAVKACKSADCCFFTSFSYFNAYDSRPSVLLCDWTYRMLIEDRCGRKPYFFESWYVRRQDRAIRNSALVVSLFKGSAARISEHCPSANVVWPAGNVINCLYDGPVDESLIGGKKASDTILFVGKPAYIEGARMLARAVEFVRKQRPGCELHCIGITESQLAAAGGGVRCYGYLRKDDARQCELYYELMRKASLFCNPTPKWAGFSSTVEAMFFYTPVVVSRYDNFVTEFGEGPAFGKYNLEFTPEALAADILSVMEDPGYADVCRKAHDAVKDYSWDVYADKILKYL